MYAARDTKLAAAKERRRINRRQTGQKNVLTNKILQIILHTLTPKQWIEKMKAIGIVPQAGRYVYHGQ